MRGRVLVAVRVGALAGWAVVALELAVVFAFAGGGFASIWEVQFGTLWLAPAACLAAGVVGGAGGVLWAVALARPLGAQVAACSIAGLLGGVAAFSVSFGRHFEDLARRTGFVALGVCLGAALLWGGAHRMPLLYRRFPRLFRLALVAALIGLELCNRFLLVRLYPGFHGTAAVLALLLAPLWALDELLPAAARRSAPQRGDWALAATLGAALALVYPSSKRLALFDNYRWVLTDEAPLAGYAVHLASALEPPPSLEQPAAATQGPASGAPLDLQGASLLLVTVDALRADHVGAYGYPRPTTPRLDALASTGVRFDHAYCPTPHTSYSLTSVMTGKYIRPLLLQGLGGDSETWATQLRRYGYKTAGFYPPAVFFIDRERFAAFDDTQLGFEYQKREFLEGAPRVQQLQRYLSEDDGGQPLFAWVHLFGPHEPYEADAAFPFGGRDIDRYDSEVASADATLGALVDVFRAKYPDGLVIVTADHGEEFGDHGGRYHGSSVYEEQVRVPLVVQSPGAIAPSVIGVPVQTIDLLPTVLGALRIPVRPSVRGRDRSGWLLSGRADDEGFAFAETEEQTLLAVGDDRLICQRRIGACKLFDVATDPGQRADLSAGSPELFQQLRSRTQGLNASHGRFEQHEGTAARPWPAAVLRGLAGDGDAAPELAELLDDADVSVRRKSAELLFSLGTEALTPALRLSLQREDDQETRRWVALSLTRLGEGAPLTSELKDSADLFWRRWAALALAEAGQRGARMQLVEWWQNGASDDFELARRLLRAFAKTQTREAVFPLLRSLDDVRLRPELAATLAEIGDETARGPLARAFADEPYHGTRERLATALVRLGAGPELVTPLRRWMGVPDPLASALQVAMQAGIMEYVGGPRDSELKDLADAARVGALVTVTVPPGDSTRPLRLLVLAQNPGPETAEIRIGLPFQAFRYDAQGQRLPSTKVPQIHPERYLRLRVPPGTEAAQQFALVVPQDWGLLPAHASHLVVFAERGAEVGALAVVPTRAEVGEEPAREAKGGKTGLTEGTQNEKQ